MTPNQKSQAPGIVGKSCLTVFMLPFLVIGIGVMSAGILALFHGTKPFLAGLGLIAFGAAFTGVALLFLYMIHVASRRAVTLSKPGGTELLDWRTSPIFPNRKKPLDRGLNGGVLLPLEVSARTGAIILFIFALIWNGIVLTILFASRSGGGGQTGVSIFLGLFLLVGVLIFAASIYQFFRAATVGDPTLEIAEEPLSPGASAWAIVRLPKPLPVNRATLSLVCREIVQYRRGTDTITHKEEVLNIPIAEVTNVRGGPSSPLLETRVEIPANAMHSFQSSNNRVVWTLNLKADIPGRPDIATDFTILVAPSAAN